MYLLGWLPVSTCDPVALPQFHHCITAACIQGVPKDKHDQVAEVLFEMADIDGDEVVSRDEFYIFFYSHFSLMRKKPRSSGEAFFHCSGKLLFQSL